MPITSLHLTDFGPFDEISFEFDPRVNVLTGPNNSGKTSALLVLGELLVYPFAAPEKLFRSNSPSWKLGYSLGATTTSVAGKLPSPVDHMQELFSAVGYTCFLPAQRAGTGFRASGPSAKRDPGSHIEDLTNLLARARPTELRTHGHEGLRRFVRRQMELEEPEFKKRTGLVLSDSFLVGDQEIIQRIIDLDYAAYRQDRPEVREVITKIVSMVSEIAEGFPMSFEGVGEDERGLFPLVATPSGVIPLDVLSQGTQSLVQCVAHLVVGYAEYYGFPTDLKEKPGVLVIDEIDAHLHPSWQRRIIPTLLRHFPKLQIFCSTHSPLMLAGLEAGQVQLLRRGEDGVLSASSNESDITGWTADEILRNFLEIPAPTDMATAAHVARLEELRHKDKLTGDEEAELQALRRTVGSELLQGPMSEQVEYFAEELKRARDAPSLSARPRTRRGRT